MMRISKDLHGAAWALMLLGLASLSPAQAASPTDADPAAGKQTYAQMCSACHGMKGGGAAGPSLKGLKQRWDVETTVEWIKNPSERMPRLYPSSLSDQQVLDVAAYVNGF
jgi:alcohol dehydrogenase (cytochrome c)